MAFDWTAYSPANKPSTRMMNNIAKDKINNKIMICLGCRNFTDTPSYTQDTWTFDGNDWTQENPAHLPTKRTYHPYTWDGKNNNIVLFGGMNSSYAALQDTWTWNGIDWSNPNPVTKPGVRHSAAIAYDPVNEYILLYGGLNGSTYLGDTFKWDGTNWTDLNPPANAGLRAQSMMCYSPANGGVIMYGGVNASGSVKTTYKWTGTTWVNLAPAHQPVQNYAGIEYCLSADLVIAHGGGAVQQTSSWDGTDWTTFNTAHGTDAATSALCEGVELGSIVAFNGAGSGVFYADIFKGYEDTWVPPVPAYPIMNNEISLLGNGAPGDSPFHHMVKLN